MNNHYKQLVNLLLERHSFSLAKTNGENKTAADNSLILGLSGLQQAAFCADDSEALNEIKELISQMDIDGYIQPYNLAVV